MHTPQFLFWLYFIIAAFSIGCMGFAGCLNAVAIRRYKLGLNSIAFYRILMSLGYILVVGTLLDLTIPAAGPGVPLTVQYVFYVGGLFIAGIGAIGLALKNIAVHVNLGYKVDDLEDNHDKEVSNGLETKAPTP